MDTCCTIFYTGQQQQRVGHVGNVTFCNTPANVILRIKILHLNAQHSSLYLVDTTVTSLHAKYILACRTIITKSTYSLCQLIVIRGYSSCIAKRPKILPG